MSRTSCKGAHHMIAKLAHRQQNHAQPFSAYTEKSYKPRHDIQTRACNAHTSARRRRTHTIHTPTPRPLQPTPAHSRARRSAPHATQSTRLARPGPPHTVQTPPRVDSTAFSGSFPSSCYWYWYEHTPRAAIGRNARGGARVSGAVVPWRAGYGRQRRAGGCARMGVSGVLCARCMLGLGFVGGCEGLRVPSVCPPRERELNICPRRRQSPMSGGHRALYPVHPLRS